jgi:transposase
MLNVETIRKVRWDHFMDGKGIREIARELNLSRNTVRTIIRSGITDQKYERSEQPHPKLGTFIGRLSGWLKEDTGKPVRHRRSAQRILSHKQLTTTERHIRGLEPVRPALEILSNRNSRPKVPTFIQLPQTKKSEAM